jgi:hypothetical protein
MRLDRCAKDFVFLIKLDICCQKVVRIKRPFFYYNEVRGFNHFLILLTLIKANLV